MNDIPLLLPTDNLRQVLWRFRRQDDLRQMVSKARAVARGPVARLVASGARKTHEWTIEKNQLLDIFDHSGITAAFMPATSQAPSDSDACKNLARAFIAFELAWVDAGAATSLLAGLLAVAPISAHGTTEQKQRYLEFGEAGPLGNQVRPWRGAFCLTEPIPYAGADATVLGGKVRIANWHSGQEPTLHVEKNGRYITNMGFANFVVVAVESADERIRGSCLIILEEGDPGRFDRGVPTRKMAHQLSSTSDPSFDLRVPASRILGGYTLQQGVIVPNFNHGELIEPVIKRSRVTVGILTSAKLLSTVEPVIRYQRNRFRGAAHIVPGTARHELGLQQHQDALHRLVEVWAAGEAGASLGFAAARLFDRLDCIERRTNNILEKRGISGRGKLRAYKTVVPDAKQLLEKRSPLAEPNNSLNEDEALAEFVLLQFEANILAPAVKLWNTGVGATMMREPVSLMGGCGITEDCPGFLGYKWIDAQLEATYEGPEALQRRALTVAISHELFPALWEKWIDEMRYLGSKGHASASSLASAMALWLSTYNFLQSSKDDRGEKLFTNHRQGVTFPLVDALCWLLSARQFVLDVFELDQYSRNPDAEPDVRNVLHLFQDLSHWQSARAAGEAARICGELVFGHSPITEDWADRPRPCNAAKAEFRDLRLKLEDSLAGSQLAKQRAGDILSKIVLPDALDYPI